MIITFIGTLKAIARNEEKGKNKITITIQSDFGRELIMRFAKSGSLPIKDDMVLINTMFPENTLHDLLNQQVNITANLICKQTYNYLHLKEITLYEKK
jgi:hypothetical protein